MSSLDLTRCSPLLRNPEQLIIYQVGILPSRFYNVLADKDGKSFKSLLLTAMLLIVLNSTVSPCEASVPPPPTLVPQKEIKNSVQLPTEATRWQKMTTCVEMKLLTSTTSSLIFIFLKI